MSTYWVYSYLQTFFIKLHLKKDKETETKLIELPANRQCQYDSESTKQTKKSQSPDISPISSR